MVQVYQQNYDAALEICDKEIANNPKSPTGWILSGITQNHIGDKEAALFNFRMAFSLEFEDMKGWNTMFVIPIFNVAFELKEYNMVVKMSEKFEKGGGEYLEEGTRQLISESYLYSGMLEEGLQYLRSTNLINTDTSFFSFLESQFFEKMGNYKDAEQALIRSIYHAPNEYKDYLKTLLVKITFKQHNYRKAQKLIRQTKLEDNVGKILAGLIEWKLQGINECFNLLSTLFRDQISPELSEYFVYFMFLNDNLPQEGIELFEELFATKSDFNIAFVLISLYGTVKEYEKADKLFSSLELSKISDPTLFEMLYISLEKISLYSQCYTLRLEMKKKFPDYNSGRILDIELYWFNYEYHKFRQELDIRLQDSPKDPITMYFLIEYFILQGNYDEAFPLTFQLPVQLGSLPIQLQVKCLYLQNDYKTCKLFIDKANSMFFEHIEFDMYRYLAESELTNNPDLAIQGLKKLIQSNPQFGDLYYYLALIYDKINEDELKDETIDEGLGIIPYHSKLLRIKFLTYFHQNKFDKVLPIINELISKDPYAVDLIHYRAMALIEEEGFESALKSITIEEQTIIDEYPELLVTYYSMMSTLYGFNGDLDKCEIIFDKLFKLDNISPTIYLSAVMVYLKEGNIKKALHYAEKAYELEPNNFQHFRSYSRLLFDNEKLHEVKTIIEKHPEFQDKDEILYLYRETIEKLERGW